MTNSSAQPVVHILHENEEWLPPLRAGLEAAGVPYREWDLNEGSINLDEEPEPGVYWSRLSASAHTRGHEYAKEYTRAVLRWLESYGRRVVNGSDVLELEVSKVNQYTALRAAGFAVPRTIAVFSTDELSTRARELPVPFITKHNQGGKGLGVRRFDSYDEFDAAIAVADPDEGPADGITLLQELVSTTEPFITRAEFVGGKFVYAVRVDTSAGSFELCPADACVVPEAGFAPAVCDVPGAEQTDGSTLSVPSLFRERTEITADHPLIVALEGFLAARGIEVAGVEFFDAADGRLIPYDINTNTNYNPDVEAANGHRAANALGLFLGAELAALTPEGAPV
ncbi:MAG: ATP-grasp domain-containing protein [Mycetocola sp.]